jgi:hypothetical protein
MVTVAFSGRLVDHLLEVAGLLLAGVRYAASDQRHPEGMRQPVLRVLRQARSAWAEVFVAGGGSAK